MKNLFLSIIVLLALVPTSSAQVARPSQIDMSDRPQVDVESYAVDITIAPEEYRLDGVAEIQFRQLDRQTFVTFDLDRRLRVSAVTIGEEPVRFRQFDLDSTLEIDLRDQAQFEESPTVRIEYSGSLRPDNNTGAAIDPVLLRVADESAYLLYDGRWYPTNGLYHDQATMRLTVNAPTGWGIVADMPQGPDGSFTGTTPGYWGMIAAGSYRPMVFNSATTNITVHALQAQDEAVFPLAERAREILDFYKETFGPSPASEFRIIEVQGANWPVQWSQGTLLLPATQFRADFNVPELAQALAHQWFPIKIGVADPARDAWLVDGLSVFASLLYFDKALSPADAQEHIDRALVKALGYEGDSTIVQAGTLEKDSAEYNALVEYKGGYVLRMLQWVIGDDKFNELLAQYLQRFQTEPASTQAFVELASTVAGEDLGYFFDQWLYSSGVPEFQNTYLVYRTATGFKVVGQVKQDLDLFRMPVELQIQTDAEPEYARVLVSGPSSDYEVTTERRPKTVVIDPRKKVLRMSPDIRVAVYINRGEEAANDGRYNEAIDEYQRALEIDPNNSLAEFRTGEALFELGNMQAAANSFRQSLNGDLQPSWVEVWAYINLGKIFDFRGDRERALTEYQKALNTGDDAYGAEAEAQKYINEPFRRSGGRTIG